MFVYLEDIVFLIQCKCICGFYFLKTFILYAWVFYVHVCSCTRCMQCLQRPEKNVGSPGTGVIVDMVVNYCGCWDSLELGFSGRATSALVTKSSLQPWFLLFRFVFQGRVFLCNLDCLRTPSVDQNDLEFIKIHLPLPP